MAISIGNALGAVTQIQTGFAKNTGEKSLLDFINKINKYGVTLKAKYEVNFSGIENITFFVTDISVPELRQNFGQVFFAGKSVEVPINFEYGHDVAMTLLNDAKGVMYTTVVNWLMKQEGPDRGLVDSGYTMTIRALGDGNNHDGMTIVLNGVRMKTVTGLNFNSSDATISTFQLNLSVVSFTSTMGKLQKVSGLAGALRSMLG